MGQKTPNSSMNQAEGQKSILNWLMECFCHNRHFIHWTDIYIDNTTMPHTIPNHVTRSINTKSICWEHQLWLVV